MPSPSKPWRLGEDEEEAEEIPSGSEGTWPPPFGPGLPRTCLHLLLALAFVGPPTGISGMEKISYRKGISAFFLFLPDGANSDSDAPLRRTQRRAKVRDGSGGRDADDELDPEGADLCADGETMTICVPVDYMKFELPEEGERATHVSIGVDIKDIPKVNDKDFSITINAYFIVKWSDQRLIVAKRNRTAEAERRRWRERERERQRAAADSRKKKRRRKKKKKQKMIQQQQQERELRWRRPTPAPTSSSSSSSSSSTERPHTTMASRCGFRIFKSSIYWGTKNA